MFDGLIRGRLADQRTIVIGKSTNLFQSWTPQVPSRLLQSLSLSPPSTCSCLESSLLVRFSSFLFRAKRTNASLFAINVDPCSESLPLLHHSFKLNFFLRSVLFLSFSFWHCSSSFLAIWCGATSIFQCVRSLLVVWCELNKSSVDQGSGWFTIRVKWMIEKLLPYFCCLTLQKLHIKC